MTEKISRERKIKEGTYENERQAVVDDSSETLKSASIWRCTMALSYSTRLFHFLILQLCFFFPKDIVDLILKICLKNVLFITFVRQNGHDDLVFATFNYLDMNLKNKYRYRLGDFIKIQLRV